VFSARRFLLFVSVVPTSFLTIAASADDDGVAVETYVETVLRAHPGARESAALEEAARAERRAGRQIADPIVALSWDRARVAEGSPSATERGISVTQTIPWPGTFSANARAADRAADVLRAEGTRGRWDVAIEARAAFARLIHARAALGIARAAAADASSLRDLTSKRAELGESRESDRIKAEVEWLRQERTRRAVEREAETAEEVLRRLAVESLPDPLILRGELPRGVPPTDGAALRALLTRANPRLMAVLAAVERDTALVVAVRRSRVPDLDVTWFRNKELDKTANGVSVGLRVPLWNANRGAVGRATANSALAAATAERTLLDLTTSLERARQELDVASAQVETLENEILPSANRSLGLARFSYEEGETSLLDLLDAQRTFRETQREALASRLALALALTNVQHLVGPDFNPGR
jgi:outer membrane protein, heavy metal efflux system